MLRALINRGITLPSSYAKLVVGSAIAALLVSLGTAMGMMLFGLEVNAAIPASLGAVAAATWAVAMGKRR